MTKKVTLDAGHNPLGNVDTGAQGNGLYEGDITLAIVKRLKPKLEHNGFEVKLTRDSGQSLGTSVTSSLQARCDISNNFGSDLFVSIHVNSFPTANVGTGSEVLICGTGGQAEDVAHHVLAELISACGWANRGVKVDPSLYVLGDNTSAPAILTENGFINNVSDASRLKDLNFIDAIATAHAKGICEFFGVAYEDPSESTVPVPTTAPSVMYRVILGGKQVMALANYDSAVAQVKQSVDGGKASEGSVQRNTDGQTLFTYNKAEPEPVPQPVPAVVLTPALPKTPIMGVEVVTVAQCEQFLHRINPAAPSLASIYKEYGEALGIRWGYAFAQMIKETGYLRFGGDVSPEQNNFAGLGAVGNGAKGATFRSASDGVLAQLEHLYAYATKDSSLKGCECVDPRFGLVSRGIAPNWEDLNGRWAVPGVGYGEDIAKIHDAIASEIVVSPAQAPVPATNNNQTFDSLFSEFLQKAKTPTFLVGVIGLLKLTTDQAGIKLPDVQWDALANDVATLFTLIGVIASHVKPQK